jgi:hypothetical protein
VAGIVLLDAGHAAINSKMPPAWQKLEAAGKGMDQFMFLASRIWLDGFAGHSQNANFPEF